MSVEAAHAWSKLSAVGKFKAYTAAQAEIERLTELCASHWGAMNEAEHRAAKYKAENAGLIAALLDPDDEMLETMSDCFDQAMADLKPWAAFIEAWGAGAKILISRAGGGE